MMTSNVPPDFFLLAHSHGVALLDGISKWRERDTTNNAERKYHYVLGADFDRNYIPR